MGIAATVSAAPVGPPVGPPLEVERLRHDFPALLQKLESRPLVYLDNAATTQKPRSVIEALRHYYHCDNANIHRGVHQLSVRATEAYEQARQTVAQFLGAPHAAEIVFVRGTTEAINLVAHSFACPRLRRGDEIVVSHLEHHSNIVPWQLVCEQTGARLRVVPIDDRGELLLGEYERLLGPRVRLVAISHVSNALGTINPLRRIIQMAHAAGVPVLVDGAQAVPHLPVDVHDLDCDFYAFSGHKVFGPTGIGVLYGKAERLADMPPWQGGGDMIKSVTLERTTYADPPHRFEAGTPNIAGAIGLGAALDYVTDVGLPPILAYEQELLGYATRALGEIPGLRLIGTAAEKACVLSFVLDGVHPHDAGTILDQEGIAVRTGHHCAQPVMDRFGVPGTVRASLAFYNTPAEIDALAAGLRKVVQVFA
jgi:cysteine desulfurase/selenocysteine lyase